MKSTRRAFGSILYSIFACNRAAAAQGPHHYIFFGRERERISEPAFLDAKGVEGAQLKYSWKQLEQGKGNYTFDDIRHDLAFLKSKGKKHFIQVQDSSFSPSVVPVPKYLLSDPEYHGGANEQYDDQGDEKHPKPAGWVARRWDPAVRERFQKLLFALGKEFDGKIEGINLPETSVGVTIAGALPPEGFTPDSYFDAIVSNMKALRQAFPKSVAMQYANFMPEGSYLSNLYRKAVELKVGMGGPDLLPNRPFQMSHCYPLLRDVGGRVPTGIAVQDGNLKDVNPKTKKQVTLPELVEFATKYLKVDYIFWGTQQPFYERDIIPFLRTTPIV